MRAVLTFTQPPPRSPHMRYEPPVWTEFVDCPVGSFHHCTPENEAEHDWVRLNEAARPQQQPVRYVILNLHSVTGFQLRYFDTLDTLFYTGKLDTNEFGSTVIVWSVALADALQFESEQAAWDRCHSIWSEHFTSRSFTVLAVHEDAFTEARELAHAETSPVRS